MSRYAGARRAPEDEIAPITHPVHPAADGDGAPVSHPHSAVTAPAPHPLLFPIWVPSFHEKVAWQLSLVYSLHRRYNILNSTDFRHRLVSSIGDNTAILRFSQTSEWVRAYNLFRLLYTPTADGIYDARALELFSLLRGGLIGGAAHIEFPEDFQAISTLSETLNTDPHDCVLPGHFLRALYQEKMLSVFANDGTATCVALCIAFRCRAHLHGKSRMEGLYTLIVDVLSMIIGRLNTIAAMAGYPSWSALVAPYLFFDVDKTMMTLYTGGTHCEPHHRISILGAIPDLTHGRVNAAFYATNAVSQVRHSNESVVLDHRDQAIRRAIRIFGFLQSSFPHYLDQMRVHGLTSFPRMYEQLLNLIQTTLEGAPSQGPM